jgi:hypothetical protein
VAEATAERRAGSLSADQLTQLRSAAARPLHFTSLHLCPSSPWSTLSRGSAAMSIARGGFQRAARRDSQRQQKQTEAQTKPPQQPQPDGPSSTPAAAAVVVVTSAELTAAAQHGKADELKQAASAIEQQQAIIPAAVDWSPASTAPSAPDAPPDQQPQQQHQPGGIRADSPNGSSANAESDGEDGSCDSYVIARRRWPWRSGCRPITDSAASASPSSKGRRTNRAARSASCRA